MNKQDLLEQLHEAMKIEERAVPLYSEHISSTIFLSGFKKADQQQIINILNILKDESSKHARIYTDLIEKIEKDDKDVY